MWSCIGLLGSSPLVVSNDADGLVCIRRPGDWSLGDHLAHGEEVGARVCQVHVVLKYACLVGKVGRFREGMDC